MSECDPFSVPLFQKNEEGKLVYIGNESPLQFCYLFTYIYT